mgnify:CR=1 FL=1
MRKILMPLALLPLLAMTGPLLAHDHVKEGDKTTCEHKNHHKKSGYHQKMLDELNLTDAQQTQIKDLKKAYWQDNRQAMKAGWQTRKEMMQLSYAESVDQAKLDSLIADSSEAHHLIATAFVAGDVEGMRAAAEQHLNSVEQSMVDDLD